MEKKMYHRNGYIQECLEMEHNYSVHLREFEMLLNLVKLIKTYSNLTDIEILDKTVYHYGGTLTASLIECLFNHSL